MPRTDMSKQCKHLVSLGEHEGYSRGRKQSWQVSEKGFRCAINKFPPHVTGPNVCVPRKRHCFEAREEAEAEGDAKAEAESEGTDSGPETPPEPTAE